MAFLSGGGVTLSQVTVFHHPLHTQAATQEAPVLLFNGAFMSNWTYERRLGRPGT